MTDFRLHAGVLAAPTLAVARNESNTVNVLTWQAQNSNVQGFEIQRKIDAGAYSAFTTEASSARIFQDFYSSTSGTYTYKIRTWRGSRYSDWSAEASLVVVTPPSGALLTESDITYLGSFKLPNTAYGNRCTCGITWRNSRLLYGGYFRSTAAIEVTVPSLRTSAPYNTAVVYKTFPDIYGNKAIKSGTNWTQHNGLFVDPAGDPDKLIWNYIENYYAAFTDRSMGYSMLNDTTSTATAVASYKFENRTNRVTCGGVLRMPDAFVTANCPGKPYGYGFGSTAFSGVGGGSNGPALYAGPEPDIGTYADGASLPNTRIIEHLHHADAYTDPQRAIRSADYYPRPWGRFTAATTTRFTLYNVGSNGAIHGNGQYNGMQARMYAGNCASDTLYTLTWVSDVTYDVSPAFPATPDLTTSRIEIPGMEPDPSYDWPINNEVGYQTSVDASIQATLWIDGNKYGILNLMSAILGRYYYHYQYPCEAYKHVMRVYDPADFAKSLAGTLDYDKIHPGTSWDWIDPSLTYPLPTPYNSYDFTWKTTNLAFDPNTRLIAAMWPGGWHDTYENYPMCSIYEVAN